MIREINDGTCRKEDWNYFVNFLKKKKKIIRKANRSNKAEFIYSKIDQSAIQLTYAKVNSKINFTEEIDFKLFYEIVGLHKNGYAQIEVI